MKCGYSHGPPVEDLDRISCLEYPVCEVIWMTHHASHGSICQLTRPSNPEAIHIECRARAGYAKYGEPAVTL